MVFLKYITVDDRNRVLQTLRALKLEYQSEPIKVTEDKILDVRVVESLLWALKTKCTEWGISKQVLWVDIPTRSLWYGPDKVLTVTITDLQLSVEYGEGFETWLSEGGDWEEILKVAKNTLGKAKAKKGAGKGAHKGKNKDKTF